MIAIREDLFENLGTSTKEWFSTGRELLEQMQSGDVDFDPAKWCYFDFSDPVVAMRAKESVFSAMVTHWEETTHWSVADAIADLEVKDPPKPSQYVVGLDAIFANILGVPLKELKNTRIPASTPKVRARFRLYQILDKADAKVSREVLAFIRGKNDSISEKTAKNLLAEALLDYDCKALTTERDVIEYLDGLKTKKYSQKALNPKKPAPAALSIPDDICHYKEPRTLSVREMARIQSFPDTFEFRGIPTTGGARRKYQVPQYTQIGNAVPPLMARAIGLAISGLLDELAGDQQS